MFCERPHNNAPNERNHQPKPKKSVPTIDVANAAKHQRQTNLSRSGKQSQPRKSDDASFQDCSRRSATKL